MRMEAMQLQSILPTILPCWHEEEKKIKVAFLKYTNKYVLGFQNIMSNQVELEMFQDG